MELTTQNVGRLKTKFMHYTYWSMEQYLRKLDRYTTQWAEQRFAWDAGPAFWKYCYGPAAVLSFVLLRRGFLDGTPGLVLCLLTSFYSFTKAAKLWALHSGREQPDPEAEHQVPQSGKTRAA